MHVCVCMHVSGSCLHDCAYICECAYVNVPMHVSSFDCDPAAHMHVCTYECMCGWLGRCRLADK